MKSLHFPARRAYATVDSAALDRNFRLLLAYARRHNRAAALTAVVKADAYGHGIDCVLPTLLRAGCDRFAVASFQEALAVRERAPKAEILIFGYTPPQKAPLLAKYRLTQTVFSADYALALAQVAKAACCRPAVHIKLDGGLCRAGLDPDPRAVVRLFCKLGSTLDITGLMTHFPCADSDPNGTKLALDRFLACKNALNAAGLHPFCHAAASAAMLALPESTLDGIRPGLALYGIPPADTPLDLRPVMALYAPVVQLRPVPADTPIGYGGDFVTKRPSLIGTLPIGYADGVCRRLCGLSVTLIHGKCRFSVPIAGRISMDQLTLDLTDTPAALGDTVCLWQSAAQPASHAGTVPYEVLTALSPRVERIIR